MATWESYYRVIRHITRQLFLQLLYVQPKGRFSLEHQSTQRPHLCLKAHSRNSRGLNSRLITLRQGIPPPQDKWRIVACYRESITINGQNTCFQVYKWSSGAHIYAHTIHEAMNPRVLVTLSSYMARLAHPWESRPKERQKKGNIYSLLRLAWPMKQKHIINGLCIKLSIRIF